MFQTFPSLSNLANPQEPFFLLDVGSFPTPSSLASFLHTPNAIFSPTRWSLAILALQGPVYSRSSFSFAFLVFFRFSSMHLPHLLLYLNSSVRSGNLLVGTPTPNETRNGYSCHPVLMGHFTTTALGFGVRTTNYPRHKLCDTTTTITSSTHTTHRTHHTLTRTYNFYRNFSNDNL